jgi:DNA mismatch repair protein MutS
MSFVQKYLYLNAKTPKPLKHLLSWNDTAASCVASVLFTSMARPPKDTTNQTASDKATPLMKQYNAIKARYPDTVLFFRMGDFFETFGEDAVITAKVAGITLTKRNNGGAGDIELAGFPHHQLDNYLPKMIRGGYRVAVCEQLEDPKLAKGIVKRDVVEVVTPGVQLNEKILDAARNTYVGSVVVSGNLAGFAYADISTGEFVAGEVSDKEIGEVISSTSGSL